MKKIMIIILMGIIAIIPFNTHAYAVAIYQLDQPIKELDNYTLRQVFDDNQLILNSHFINNDNWILYGDVYINTSYLVFNSNIDSGAIQFGFNAINGNSIYIVALINDYVSGYLYVNTSNIQNKFIYENGLTSFIYEYDDSLGRFVIDDITPSIMDIDYIRAYNLTLLGLDNLTVEQMDKYYNLYLQAVRYEQENKEAVKDEGNYKHIFMSIYEGLTNLMKSMGSVWTFLSTPIINSNITEMGELFNIDWSWNIFDIFRQLITDLALFVLQLNTYIVSSLFFALGIPIKISILSLVFSDFVFVVLTWIIFKSFII